MKIKNIQYALLLSSSVSLTFGIVFAYTMLASHSIQGLPEHSRLADINGYHEGWIESIIFFIIGIFGLYNLKELTRFIKKSV